jgi:hypothetical protein
VPDGPPVCDEPGCDEQATHSYTWDWGQSGVKCSKHAALLGQVAANLSRNVSVHPLQAIGPAPLTRDERIQLRVKAEVLGAELEDAKARGLELYRDNQALTRQVQTLTLRAREADAQIKDRDVKLTEMQGQLDERDAVHAEMADELDRLRTLAKFVPDDTQITRGLQPPQNG